MRTEKIERLMGLLVPNGRTVIARLESEFLSISEIEFENWTMYPLDMFIYFNDGKQSVQERKIHLDYESDMVTVRWNPGLFVMPGEKVEVECSAPCNINYIVSFIRIPFDSNVKEEETKPAWNNWLL